MNASLLCAPIAPTSPPRMTPSICLLLTGLKVATLLTAIRKVRSKREAMGVSERPALERSETKRSETEQPWRCRLW